MDLPAGAGVMQIVKNDMPSMMQIVEGKEVVIKLPKDSENDDYGLELIGGRHSYLGSICIHKIYKDSAVHLDGRLKRGDVILAVNGKSMNQASLEEAKSALMDADAPLQITIVRDPDPIKLFTSIEEPKIFITVELWKNHSNDPLGISVMERKGIGVFVTWINPESPAGKNQRIRQGDKVIDINGRPVKGLDQAQVAALLREAEHSIVLVFGRIPALYSRIQEWAREQHHLQKLDVIRTASWSHSESHSMSQRNWKATRKIEENGLGKKQMRRYSAFNLRLRSNSTQMERLAIQSIPQSTTRK